MTGRASRFAALPGVVVLLAATAALPAGPAQAAGLPGMCPDADGVTVVVDFQGLGGPTLIRCAPGPQPTGLAALKNAGISITGTARWGEAFICRIEGKPGADTEPCIDTPPASAYWSYWHAPNGGSWTYSQHGATYRTPPPGSFEGWSFGMDRSATGAPSPQVAPRRPAAATPPPSSAAPRPADPPDDDPGGDPGDAGPDPGPGSGGDGPPVQDPAATTPVPPSVTTAVPAGPTGTGPATRHPVPSGADNGVDSAAPRSGSGVPVGTLTGLGLLAALIVAAGVTAWRRRRAAHPSGPDG